MICGGCHCRPHGRSGRGEPAKSFQILVWSMSGLTRSRPHGSQRHRRAGIGGNRLMRAGARFIRGGYTGTATTSAY